MNYEHRVNKTCSYYINDHQLIKAMHGNQSVYKSWLFQLISIIYIAVGVDKLIMSNT